ncbi:membrane fusion protein (multidrug efflux system) [Bradyrhizobium sp. USDA 377]
MRPPIVRAVPLLALLSLAACGEQSQQAGPRQMVPEVGVLTLKPQEAKISTVLPGRVVAYQVSEVRPQVTGILLKRDFVEGAEVKEGDLLYEIDPVQYKAALASAEAAVQRSEATLVSVKLKAARKTQLLQTNAASQQDVDDAVAAYKQGEADVKAAEANRDTATISLDRTKVTASISGRIGKSSITPGALVTASQATAMTTIQQLDPVYVDLDQSTSEMERLRNQIASGKLKRPVEGVQVELLMESGKTYGHKGKYGFTDASVNESTARSPRARSSPTRSGRCCRACMSARASSPASIRTRSWCRSGRSRAIRWGRRWQCSSTRTARSSNARWISARTSTAIGWCDQAPSRAIASSSTERRRPVPAPPSRPSRSRSIRQPASR